MTPEEEFEKWWSEEFPHWPAHGDSYSKAQEAYLAATKRTAQECVEICHDIGLNSHDVAQAITERFLK